MTTLKSLVWYWYHNTAMSGTTTPLRLVPQKCYSGTERVILSTRRGDYEVRGFVPYTKSNTGRHNEILPSIQIICTKQQLVKEYY
jgi:hypothetical protein